MLTTADVADEDVEGMGLSTAEDGVDDVVEVVDDTRRRGTPGNVATGCWKGSSTSPPPEVSEGWDGDCSLIVL